jgi:hypothetical protein
MNKGLYDTLKSYSVNARSSRQVESRKIQLLPGAHLWKTKDFCKDNESGHPPITDLPVR